MQFNELREKYPEFHYHGSTIEETKSQLKVVYHFEIVGLQSFYPSYVFPKKDETMMAQTEVVKNLIFSLGLVELVSYWKVTCSPQVIVHEAMLTEVQKAWWKKLYFHGLGEFFYTNSIDISQDEMMEIISFGEVLKGESFELHLQGNLIPVGGGKDSFVTLELLKEMKEENCTFVINGVKSALRAVEAAGYRNQHIQVERKLDSHLFELNKQGFLNGHTPFSAMVAFASVLAAVLWGKKYVCLSNESSANESTIKDEAVNHQYSKSYEFEKDFKEYLNEFIFQEVHYFSLLRCLSELQIASIFSTLKSYLPVFKSCNVGSKDGVWCGHCAKCLFVYVLLSAFLEDSELMEIFGENLLEKESLKITLMELCGAVENKPFECVGTREEVQVAMSMAISKRGEVLPLLYKQAQTWNILVDINDIEKYRQEFNEENLIPEQYISAIKEKVRRCWK
ncbi:MAG: hypothetical protein ACK5LZ_02970 [Anaerorhabdus sp.]